MVVEVVMGVEVTQPLVHRGVPHLLHAILTLLTGGGWLCIWIADCCGCCTCFRG